MASVTVRELRNHGGEVLDRVVAGERITITKHGKPVADLVPHRPRGTPIDIVLGHLRNLPPVDYAKMRADLDEIIDPRLLSDDD
jgi:prevent-host-death family protein